MELKKTIPAKKLPLPALEKKDKGIDKEVVLYIHRENTNMTCGQCVFIKGNKCKLYGISTTVSRETGSCGMFVKGEENDSIPFIGTLTKVETGYLENKNGFTCSRCEEFLPGQRTCKKVNKDSKGDDPGKIEPGACCNRWTHDPVRGNMTDEQLTKVIK